MTNTLPLGGWLFAALLACAQAPSAMAADEPTLRAVSTPAGPMWAIDPAEPAQRRSHKRLAPGTDVVVGPGGEKERVLRERAVPVSRGGDAHLDVLSTPSGASISMLPADRNSSATVVTRARPPMTIIDIDPARSGTRISDQPQYDVLYRRPASTPKPAR